MKLNHGGELLRDPQLSQLSYGYLRSRWSQPHQDASRAAEEAGREEEASPTPWKYWKQQRPHFYQIDWSGSQLPNSPVVVGLFFCNFSQQEWVLLLRGQIAFQIVTGLKEPICFSIYFKHTQSPLLHWLFLKAELTGVGNLSTRNKLENRLLRIKWNGVLQRPSGVLKQPICNPQPLLPRKEGGERERRDEGEEERVPDERRGEEKIFRSLGNIKIYTWI